MTSLVLKITGFIVDFGHPNFRYMPQYAKYNSEPYTGISYKFYGQTWKLYKIQFFWQGKQELTEHRWFRNGKKWQEIHYQQGKRHGFHKSWYSSGKVQFIKHFQHDMASGEFWGWHSNGVVSDFHYFIHGKQVVYKSFISDGKPFYNYVYRDEKRVGMQGGNYCKVKKL